MRKVRNQQGSDRLLAVEVKIKKRNSLEHKVLYGVRWARRGLDAVGNLSRDSPTEVSTAHLHPLPLAALLPLSFILYLGCLRQGYSGVEIKNIDINNYFVSTLTLTIVLLAIHGRAR